MPFQSEKQRRYLHANHPEIANRWERDYAGGGFIPSHEAGIYGLAEGGQLVKPGPGRPGYGGPHETEAAGRAYNESRGGDAGNVNINPHFDSPAVVEEQERTDVLNRRNEWRDRNDNNKKKDWVNKNLDTLDAGLKLKNFATSLNPLDLFKPNLPLIGGNYIYNKLFNRNKNKNTTLGYDNSIDFGQGLGDDAKVLGDTDFSEIEGQEAKLKGLALAQKRVLEKKEAAPEIYGPLDEKGKKFLDKLRKMDKEEKMYSKPIVTAAEGGIAGLKDGGRTGFFTGMREAEQQAQHGDVAHGPGGRFDVANQPTQTTPREAPPGEKGGPGYVSSEDLQKQQLKDFVNKQEVDWGKYDNPLDKYSHTPQGTINRENFKQKQALDNWNQVKDTTNTWLKKKAGKKLVDQLLLSGATFGLSDVFGGILQAFKQNKAKQEFIDVIKGSIAEYEKLGFAKHNPHKDTLIQDLNQQLLDLTQTRSTPEDGGPDGITGIASITYDDMEDTNRKEMAAAEWRTKQKEVDRSKQMAFWQMMMAPYMGGTTPKKLAAQGGRVPGGYNTGGLSNLFRLKNR